MSASPTVIDSYCRVCVNHCPTRVQVDDGAIGRITGADDNPLFDGYTCVKGRVQGQVHRSPQRLLHSLARRGSGFDKVSSTAAMDEVAEKLSGLLSRHRPRSIASYQGNSMIGNPVSALMLGAFMDAIGSPMRFSSITIDKPGKQIALAMHGSWMAPLHGYHNPDVALLFGLNPFKSYYGVACGHPSKWLNERLAAGMQVIAVDPRKSDIAKRATIHLQARPGSDPAILACMVRTILWDGLHDAAFLAENARGLEGLRHSVAPFTLDVVAAHADVPADDLALAAHTFARATRGYAAAGVGPGFSSGTTLVEYLILVLETVCGHWLRAGDQVVRMPTLMSLPNYRAQASSPVPGYGFGERLRVRGLTDTAAGMPTSGLAGEILLDGEGQVRALLSLAGNPANAWPDQLQAIDAMKSLELLVQFDPWMSTTARLADYVIAPMMMYEVPGATYLTDQAISVPSYYGPAEAYSQYTPAVVDPPAGSDVVSEWEFLYGVAQRMGLKLRIKRADFTQTSHPGTPLDMDTAPTADELLEIAVSGSRIPLADVKSRCGGSTYPDPKVVVAERTPGWTGRFDLSNSDMTNDLAAHLASIQNDRDSSVEYPFRLVCERLQHVMNSTLNFPFTNRGRGYNPARMHPTDMHEMGITTGDEVIVASRRSAVQAIVQADPTLRRGLVAMAHGFGGGPDQDDEFRTIGSPTTRLNDADDVVDRYVGMPRFSNIPVAVRPSTST
jgi:anaerobic selenocysteine-containing dehydrogenase